MHKKEVDEREKAVGGTHPVHVKTGLPRALRHAALVLYGIMLYLASVSGVGSSPSFLMNSLDRRL